MLNNIISRSQNKLNNWLIEKISDKHFTVDIFSINNLTETDLLQTIKKIKGFMIVPSREGQISKVVNENSEYDWGKNTEHFPFHLDGGYYKKVPQYVILYCVKNSKNGGETFFVKADSVIENLVKKYDTNFLNSLVSVYISPSQKIYEKPFWEILPHANQINYYSSMYLKVDHTKLVNSNRRILTELLYEFLHDLHQQLKTNIFYSHKWKPGDLVLFDNKRLLHGRTQIQDQLSQRLLYRMWFDFEGFELAK